MLRSVCGSAARAWLRSQNSAGRGVISVARDELRPAEKQSPSQLPGRDEGLSRVEAILFLAREPLTSRKLAQMANLEDGTRARALVRNLNKKYDEQGRSFRVAEIAGGFQLLTRTKFAAWIRRSGRATPEVRISAPTMETLAVVAYRQPILKAEIEAVRGVNCTEIIRQLMERDLITIGGRSDELGRPYLYTTTKRFLQLFGLRTIEDLPKADFVRSASLPPVAKLVASVHHVAIADSTITAAETDSSSNDDISIDDKESDVSVTLTSELAYEEKRKWTYAPAQLPDVRLDVRLEDEDDDIDDEESDDDEDEDWDDDEEEDDEEEDDDLDDELDDEEWEEVEDEEDDDDLEDDEEDDEEWDDEEDEDEDWDDDDDDADDEEEDEDDEE